MPWTGSELIGGTDVGVQGLTRYQGRKGPQKAAGSPRPGLKLSSLPDFAP